MKAGQMISLRGESGRFIYVWAALAAAAIAVTGFARTYYLKSVFDGAPLPVLLHIHGAIMTLWCILFITQTCLVAGRRVDLHRRLVTPWIAANLSMRQSLWTCNPAIFDDPFKFVPMFVTQPYYMSGKISPYTKAREVLERAGASSDVTKAKRAWLTNCKNQSDETRTKVQASTDLQKTVQELGVADLTSQLIRLQKKAAETQQK
jgi:hypothetical protein